MDSKHLHFDINEDDSEGVFMVDTWSSSLCKLPASTISQDGDVEKGEAPN